MGILSGWQDSNLRPPGPKPGAITGLRYIPSLLSGEGGIRTLGTELPVRQFSKLLISATHPPHRRQRQLQPNEALFSRKGCKYNSQSGKYHNKIQKEISKRKPRRLSGFCMMCIVMAYIAASCTFWVSSITFSRKIESVSIKSFTVWQLWITVVWSRPPKCSPMVLSEFLVKAFAKNMVI